MTTAHFQPKGPNGKAYWEAVYPLFESAAPGDVIAFPQIEERLGTKNHAVVYASVRRAAKQLQRERKRDILPVRGVGYRILRANEHADKATMHQKKGSRQIVKAVATLRSTQLGELTSGERERHLALERGMALLASVVGCHAVVLARHDAMINALTPRLTELESRVNDLESR